MKKTLFSRKPLQVGVALFAMVASLVAMPASAFAAKVGPGKYVVITQPLTLTLDCDDTSWNPTCTTSSVSSMGLTVYSWFYIDGRVRATGDVTLTTVCSRYRLYDGWHTARLYARDSNGNSANIGSYPIIHCDRTGPLVYTGVRRIGHVYVANPTATDRWSGVNTKTFTVDSTVVAWQSYWNICQNLSLSIGQHVAMAQATDFAGNSSARVNTFYCY
jgi:hypothetical protein